MSHHCLASFPARSCSSVPNPTRFELETCLQGRVACCCLLHRAVSCRALLLQKAGWPPLTSICITVSKMVAGGSGNAQPLPFANMFAASAIAACTAEALTLPLDTAKVRLQLQKDGNKYKGLIGTVGTIAREEGAAALWKGIEPGLHRQCLFGGLRIGMYEPVRNLYVGKDFKGDPPLHMKIAAGLTTGALGIMVASPTDLVKVRMQAEGKLAEGVPRKYPSAFGAYGIIVREEGVLGLWKGVGPNIARNAIINAAELASYDQVKEMLLKTGVFQDNVVTHLLSGLGAGFIAVCVGSPVDVVKSRVMGDKEGRFAGVLDCFVKTARQEGLPAFYKGFIPNFGRLGSWNVAMFLTLEQVKKLVTPKSPEAP